LPNAGNWLVKVTHGSDNLLVEYRYDRLRRRTVISCDFLQEPGSSDPGLMYDALDLTYLFYSTGWQAIEQHHRQRYVDEYGQIQLDAGHTTQYFTHDANCSVDGNSSDCTSKYLHQGGRFDSVSGLYDFRNRDYSPTLGNLQLLLEVLHTDALPRRAQ